MPTPNVLAGDIMDAAAALLNDVDKQVYTYEVQLPYLRMALLELREIFELSNIPVTNETSAIITLAAGTEVVSFDTSPALPTDLVELREVWESGTGLDNWTEVVRKELLPAYLEGQEISQFLIYEWSGNEIKLLPANAELDLKLKYIRNLFTDVLDENTDLLVINGESYLNYKTAALLSRFIDENDARGDNLDARAEMAIERSLSISTKGKQSIGVRRRPFRSGWKSRGAY